MNQTDALTIVSAIMYAELSISMDQAVERACLLYTKVQAEIPSWDLAVQPREPVSMMEETDARSKRTVKDLDRSHTINEEAIAAHESEVDKARDPCLGDD